VLPLVAVVLLVVLFLCLQPDLLGWPNHAV